MSVIEFLGLAVLFLIITHAITPRKKPYIYYYNPRAREIRDEIVAEYHRRKEK